MCFCRAGAEAQGTYPQEQDTVKADATVRALEQHRAQGLVINITRYNEAIVANWRANRADVCLELYRQLLKDGVLPNKWTFNAVAGACARRGLAQEVCASLHLDQRHLALPGTFSSSTALSANHVPALFPTHLLLLLHLLLHLLLRLPFARRAQSSLLHSLEQGPFPAAVLLECFLLLECRPGRLHPVRGSGVTARAHMPHPQVHALAHAQARAHAQAHKRTRTPCLLPCIHSYLILRWFKDVCVGLVSSS